MQILVILILNNVAIINKLRLPSRGYGFVHLMTAAPENKMILLQTRAWVLYMALFILNITE